MTYRALAPGAHVARTDRVSDDVNVDYDENGEVLGIELLSLDDEALADARAFAAAHGFAFPGNLENVSATAI